MQVRSNFLPDSLPGLLRDMLAGVEAAGGVVDERAIPPGRRQELASVLLIALTDPSSRDEYLAALACAWPQAGVVPPRSSGREWWGQVLLVEAAVDTPEFFRDGPSVLPDHILAKVALNPEAVSRTSDTVYNAATQWGNLGQPWHDAIANHLSRRAEQ